MHIRSTSDAEVVQVEGIAERKKAENLENAKDASKFLGKRIASWMYGVEKKDLKDEKKDTSINENPPQKKTADVAKEIRESETSFYAKVFGKEKARAKAKEEALKKLPASDRRELRRAEKEKAEQKAIKKEGLFTFSYNKATTRSSNYGENKKVDEIVKRYEARNTALKK